MILARALRVRGRLASIPTSIQYVCQLRFNSDINSGCCKASAASSSVKEIGQPTYWSHPHLFDTPTSSEESLQQVTPGITKSEFEARRNTYVRHLLSYQNIYFSSRLSEHDKQRMISSPNSETAASQSPCDHNFVAIIPSNMTTYMAPDVPHTFKQNSDFLYLTGFEEPNSVLVISRTDSDTANNTFKAALFVPDADPHHALWHGPRTSPSMVDKLCGIKHAYGLGELKDYLKSLSRETSATRRLTLWRYPSAQVYRNESGPNCVNEAAEAAVDAFVEEEKSSSNKLIDMDEQDFFNGSKTASYYNSSRYFVQLCRVKKSPSELACLRQAGVIASEALINSMRISHPLINESLLYSKFEYDCKIRGAEYLSYIPVIAGGPRATVLHYIRNNQLIQPNSLVLMDAGCQYRSYTSDITRTWPIGGRFTKAQRSVYQACLNIQKHCLDQCRPGMQLSQLYTHMLFKLSEELANLGIISPSEHAEATKSESMPFAHIRKISKYCVHDIGHYLGMDIHDCPEITKRMQFEPGTVVTVEPGIYIGEDDETVPASLRGIGIRIEDDVAITSSGYEILSAKCPKEVDEIEKLMTA